ncbi:glycosyltransferase [Patescibacteria group bacterium]|nr:glycosyltransferase [Patescibacteria group bacterium]
MSDLYNIICLSNQLWLQDYWTNKSHVMSRLSKLGHTVLFVEPPINVGRLFVRQVLKGAWSIKRLLTRTKLEQESGVRIYSPLNILPRSKITSHQHIKNIIKATKKYFDPNQSTILWVYHVQLFNLLDYVEQLPHAILVYDCVDNYLGFPENSSFYSTSVSRKQLVVQEAELAKRADLVFASAPGLVDRLKALNPKTYFTPNVGDYDKFKNAKQLRDLPAELAELPKPVVGFTGALDDYKFDLELFKKVAGEHPGYSFVLIGSLAIKGQDVTKRTLGLGGFDNVHLLGPRPYAEIQNYFAGFSAFIIPYQVNDYTVGGCFPVKFHDALAAGLPVVVTDLPAYALFDSVCYISKTGQDFSDNVRKAIEEDSAEKIRARQTVAKEHNWDGKVANMLKLIKSL